ncbi:MAG: diaminopimelate decarboxylase [Planctomycetota bacterium]
MKGDDVVPTPRDGRLPAAFSRVDAVLACEAARLDELAAQFGTPLYVYAQGVIEARFALLRRAFGPAARICYAVKANSNLRLLQRIGALGAGFDVVSGGELLRLRHLGLATGGRVVFAGVAKQAWEVDAAIDAGVLFFNIESAAELDLIEERAAGRGPLPVAVRLNPDVTAGGHDYLSTARGADKFGLDLEVARGVLARIAASPVLRLVGLHVHLGSQIRTVAPYLAAFDVVRPILDEARQHHPGLRYYDLGGGFAGLDPAAPPFDVDALGAALGPRLSERGLTAVMEPGRFLVGDAGVLLTTVLGVKQVRDRQLAIVDAAMNDLIRPALYGAEHPVVAVQERATDARARYDVVGPVCEAGDFLARDCELPCPRPGDVLAVGAAGAYGMAMASNYNSRPRPAEVLVAAGQVELIRRRERPEELWQHEGDAIRTS